MADRPRLRGVGIGAGYFAPFQYEAWARIPEVEIVALYNRTEERARPLMAEYGVARYYGINADELKGKSRHKQIVEPRQLAMYLLREDAHLSTPEIGRLLNRDHTTVLHGLKQVVNDIARDGPSRAAVRGVREVIAGGSRRDHADAPAA